jgi:signal transduction histidine kinase
MGPIAPPSPGAPLLQAIVTLGLALLLAHLHRRHGKAHFRWWAVALLARVLSVAAIVTFMITERYWLLYLHQVFLGWTAFGFLYAAQVFARQVAWDQRFWGFVAFPVVWSAFAIFVLDNFALAAGLAVLFLALATLWAGVVFLRYRQRTGSPAAGFLSWVMFLWALHHLDYPLLRARGAWDPWGYYLDILFVLAMGAGVLLLVIEEQREGLRTLTALSGDLRGAPEADTRDALLERPLGLRGVRGAALVLVRGDTVEPSRGVGDAARWNAATLPASVRELVRDAARTGRTRLEGHPSPDPATPPFAAALPLSAGPDGTVVMVVVGDIAAPFAALDDDILRVVGEQVGHALERAALSARLAQRTDDLERLSVRMLQEHEAQRRRLGRELHDETAQVFSALKLQLGLLREETDAGSHARFDRLLEWVDRGSTSIRNATDGLRPAVLDDLGLVPALRALCADVREWSGLVIAFDSAGWPIPGKGLLSPAAEVALFRALQEALSNASRHAGAANVSVRLEHREAVARLVVRDDGAGMDAATLTRLSGGPGRSGLVGMRERVAAAGGMLALAQASPGLEVTITIPTRSS